MDEPLTLGIDSGTSSCKVLVLAPDGSAVGRGSASHEIHYPAPGQAEQDPDVWWEAARIAIGQLDANVRASVRAISVSSQREGLVVINERGRPLAPCMIWLDRRAESSMDELLASVSDEELSDITGLRADPVFSLSRILWMRKEAPGLLNAATCLLQPSDYLVHRLTGALVTDLSMASRTCMLDIRSRSWSDTLLDRLSIDRRLLPEIVEPGTPVGRITRTAARYLGLPRAVEVVAGAGDQHAMAISNGAHKAGVMAASLGTSTSVVAVIEDVVLDPQRRVLTNCAALPGHWDLQAPIWTTGGSIEWLSRLTGRSPSTLVDLAFASEPGARGVIAIPHLIGAGSPSWCPEARAAILNLGPGHEVEDVARAVLEFIGAEIRVNLEVVGQLARPAELLGLDGGLLADERVAGLLAAMIGIPLVAYHDGSASARGVAAVAAVRTGIASSLDDVLEAHEGTTHSPDPDLAARYDHLFGARPDAVAGALRAVRRASAPV